MGIPTAEVEEAARAALIELDIADMEYERTRLAHPSAIECDSVEDYYADYRRDPVAFRKEKRLLDNGHLYGDAFEPWQEKLQIALDETDRQFRYIQLPRGSDKTGALAWRALHDAIFGPLGAEILFYAEDNDQARIALNSLKRMIRRGELPGLNITRNEVRYEPRDSVIRIEASDAPSSWGQIPYKVYIEELHAWRKQSSIELWEAIISSTGKVPNCTVTICTNAGWDETSICFKIYELSQKDPAWFHYAPDGYLAGWVAPEWLEAMQRTLSKAGYERLILNRWSSSDHNPFTTKEHVDACCRMKAPRKYDRKRGPVVIGIDLGLKHDLASVAAVQKLGGEMFELVDMAVWKGSVENPIPLREVRLYVRELKRRYQGAQIYADPWQAAEMIQDERLEEFTFTPSNLAHLTTVLKRVVNEERFRFWPGAGEMDGVDLAQELIGLITVQMGYGERIDHRAGKTSDRAVSVGIPLAVLVQEEEVSHVIEVL